MSKEVQKSKRWFASVKKLYKTRAPKILLWGPWGTGKTYMLGTMPGPVYIFDTELGATSVMHFNFPERVENDEIFIAEVGVVDPATQEINPELTLNNFEKAMKELLPEVEERGTLAIDSGTIVWQTLGWWLDDTSTLRVGKSKEKFMRTEWGKANRRFYNWVMRLVNKKQLNVVITAHTQDIYDASGNLVQAEGKMRINKQTPHWVDFVYHMLTRTSYTTTGKGETKKTIAGEQRIAILEKCRFADVLQFTSKEREVENLTFDKMVVQLNRLGLSFSENGTVDKGTKRMTAKTGAKRPMTREQKVAKMKEKASWRERK